jgi:hypothetical protein
MELQFTKHYTLDEARALLPRIRVWLDKLVELRASASDCDNRLSAMLADGADLGGETVNGCVRVLAQIKSALREFQTRDIQLKDLDRGLIDFPAIRAGREVFLCWEKDEDDIEHWHDLNSGYAGREPL